MIRAGGIFGSTREAFEMCNALMRQGHEATVYTDEGRDLGWLPNTLTWKHTREAVTDELDLLVWSDTPDDPYWDVFWNANAKLKAYCVMGFDPADAGDLFLTDRHDKLVRSVWAIADGSWQLPYLYKYTDNVGPAIGGVNVKMFRPVASETEFDVVWSGDPRPRKGGDVVKEALAGLKVGSYSKKRIPQDGLSHFICKAPIFVDGHNRGGHCNPVLEAMACGRAVVCTDTPCNSSFAIDGVNCMKVPVGDATAMRRAVDYLLTHPGYLVDLSQSAIKMAQSFDYDKIASRFRYAILERLPQ